MTKNSIVRIMMLGAAVSSMGFVSGCIYDERPRPVVYESAPAPAVAVAPDQAPPDGAIVEQQPQQVVEVVPAQPGPDVVWVGGFYFWSGGRYMYHPGYWGHPPYRGAHWEGGGWVHVRGGVRYAPGHWR